MCPFARCGAFADERSAPPGLQLLALPLLSGRRGVSADRRGKCCELVTWAWPIPDPCNFRYIRTDFRASLSPARGAVARQFGPGRSSSIQNQKCRPFDFGRRLLVRAGNFTHASRRRRCGNADDAARAHTVRACGNAFRNASAEWRCMDPCTGP